MADTIRIQMMDHFLIYIDEKKTDQLAVKSKKGAALVQYLILNEGERVRTRSCWLPCGMKRRAPTLRTP